MPQWPPTVNAPVKVMSPVLILLSTRITSVNPCGLRVLVRRAVAPGPAARTSPGDL